MGVEEGLEYNKVGLYTRVSTDLQDLEKQVSSLIRWAKKRGYNYKLYKDPGFSRMDFNRPDYQTLLEDVRNKEIDAVVVFKLDRMGAGVKDMVGFVEFLKEYNCSLISITENIDPSSALGWAMMQVSMVFSELEVNHIRERTLWAMNTIKEDNEGKPKMEQYNIGRPPRGYTSENGKLRPLTEEEKQQRLKEKLKEYGYNG